MKILAKVALFDDNGNRISDFYDSINTISSEYFAIVTKTKDGKRLYNFLTEKGKELSKEWFMHVHPFEEGDEAVVVQHKDLSFNLLTREGKLVLRKNDYEIHTNMRNGVARVSNNRGEENFVNAEGKLISKKWFDAVGPWENGGAEVSGELVYCANYLKKDGTFLLPRLLPKIKYTNKFNLAYTSKKLWVISKPEYEIVSEIECNWDRCNYTEEGLILINNKEQYNILSSKTGKLIWDTWKENIRFVTKKYIAAVERTGNEFFWHLYDKTGRKVIEQGFTEMVNLSGSIRVKVIKDGKEERAWLNTKTFELDFIE